MERDRSVLVWFGFGAILGAIALLLLVAAPPGRCRSCWTPTRGWLRICSWCHQDVNVIPLETRSVLAKLATAGDASPRAAAPVRPPARAVVEASKPAQAVLLPMEAGTGSGVRDSHILATAIYVTGSTALESGQRYIIGIDGARLRFLGPVDIDPSAVALDLDVRRVDATALEGRVLITQPGSRSGSVHAFMSVAGTTPDGLAAAIVEAARSAVGV
jgi:hypothetical protein